jgi:5-methylcytosine-specific restriction endonuclease McrA
VQEALSYYTAMYGCFKAMPEHEKRALLEWERHNLDGCSVSTSDWPGWVKYIGHKPEPPPQSLYRKIPIPATLRLAVFKRDNFTCVDCGTHDNLTADHVIPEIHGGPQTLDNLSTRCRSCNSKKGSRMPI